MRFVEQVPSLTGWLADAADPARLTAALGAADPALADRLVRCQPKKLRLVDTDGTCRGSYQLTLRRADGATETAVVEGTVRPPADRPAPDAATGTYGSPDWSVRLGALGVELSALRPEVGLASYDDLLDPDAAPAIITEILATGPRATEGVVVRRAVPTVMRYKRGSRCTFKHRVEVEFTAPLPPGAVREPFPDTVVVKTYAGDKGAVADRSMRELWDSAMRRSTSLGIAEPLGYDPDRRILLQGPVPESRTLKAALVAWFAGAEAADWDELVSIVRRVGSGLAELHQSDAGSGETVVIDDEIAEIRGRAARVRAAFPDHTPLLEQLETAVVEMATSSEPEPFVGTHRSFRPAQVLIAGDHLSLIDFDGFCQAEPSMDTGMFTSMLRAISLTKGLEDQVSLATMEDETRAARLAEGAALCASFLEGYAAVRPVDLRRVLAWETAHVGSLVVSSWTKLKLSRLPNTLYLFDDQLERNAAVLHRS